MRLEKWVNVRYCRTLQTMVRNLNFNIGVWEATEGR